MNDPTTREDFLEELETLIIQVTNTPEGQKKMTVKQFIWSLHSWLEDETEPNEEASWRLFVSALKKVKYYQ